ncbi:MAG TPA: c-type cytochrome biogenesis protein CcsB [Desulfomonilaceae bacterium]|nr:c-type cytochrome biogenesis protein CcsB [Desulfomonilaceae bacterium]
MASTDLNTYVTFGYMLCGLCYLIVYVACSVESNARKWVLALLLVVWCAHTVSIGLRWVESYQMGIGHAPLSNLYESLIFFGWAITLGLILVQLRFQSDIVIVLGLPLVFLVMAYTFLLDDSIKHIKPLIPALQSNWLVAHVITCFLGYAGFTASFVAAVLLLLSRSADPLQRNLPSPEVLDEIVYRSVLVGYPMLSLGIITGAAWADYAWGTYWSWDPKETWSLITWLVYSAFLHARLTRGWTGERTAILSVAGFAAVLFTYFGVNYLPGLHSYF